MWRVKNYLGLVLGPIAFILFNFFFKLEGLSDQGHGVLAVTLWIAIWWISEAIPVAVTALLPIILFPLCGAMGIKETTSAYGHPIIFLFMGGFVLAIALEKWHLHKRLALLVISVAGTNGKKLILGFMVATAFLSMWISNTAAAIMMLPIAMAVIPKFNNDLDEKSNNFGKALMLGIAYSASIGGVATLVGTPPNLILAGVIRETFNVELSFVDWLKIGLPFSIVMLLICWKCLSSWAFKISTGSIAGGKAEIQKQLKELGKISIEEKRIAVVFVLTALAWITRSYLIQPFLPAIDDTVIAIVAAVALFLIPSSAGDKLLNWNDMVKIPWGIILLFGGGISLAVGFDQSGLAMWIGSKLSSLEGISVFILVLSLIAMVNFLTEITSNLATTAVILPILIPLALVVDVHPYVLMVGAAIAASCAFMLPVATPPNAIVYGSGEIQMSTMIKSGIWLNVISIILLTLLIYFILPLAWGIQVSPYPEGFLGK